VAGEIDLNDPKVVEIYDDLPLWSAMAGQLLLRYLPLAPELRVLDVGCGTGFPTLELAQRLGPAASVIGIDPWAAAIARARRKAKILGVNNVTFIDGDATAIPFPHSSFDLIVSNLGLNNFSDPLTALTECRRVARPGSCLALATNLQGTMAEFYAIFRSVLNAPAAEALDTHVAQRATIPGIFALMERTGFQPGRSVEERMAVRFANGTALLQHSFIRLGFFPAWRSLVMDAEWPEVFERLRAALDAHAAQHDWLQLTVPMAYVEGRAV
jgi:ubiquinone/menaquinone biosynthesis C-methylase UbiE